MPFKRGARTPTDQRHPLRSGPFRQRRDRGRVGLLAPLDGDLTVEVAPKAGLTCIRAYSDIDDRERFEGTGETVTIPTGGVAVVEIDEAYRVVADAADPRVVVLHVTVEGYSFPNK